MTHSMIGGRHGKTQVAMFLQDIATEMQLPLMATSGIGNYNLYDMRTWSRVFVGNADDALTFLDESARVLALG